MAAGLVGWTFATSGPTYGTFVAAGAARGIFCGLWLTSSAILVAGLAKGTFSRLGPILRDF